MTQSVLSCNSANALLGTKPRAFLRTSNSPPRVLPFLDLGLVHQPKTLPYVVRSITVIRLRTNTLRSDLAPHRGQRSMIPTDPPHRADVAASSNARHQPQRAAARPLMSFHCHGRSLTNEPYCGICLLGKNRPGEVVEQIDLSSFVLRSLTDRA